MTTTIEGRTIDETLERAGRAREAFLRVTAGRAQRDAERAAGSIGPLAGVPFAVKDVFDVRGTRTTGGSQLFDHRPPAREDAEAVRRLSEAGAVCIGKTTLSELAYSGLGVNDRFGTPTIRREGREYLIGGSSSGSAAAVRAGIVPIALASDTSGSARIPAAWTGVAGFRPSIGRYSRTGMLGLAPTLDTVGIIADRVSRLAAVDRVLSGASGGAEASSAPAFAIPHDEYLASCDPRVLERFHQDVERLRSLGLRVAQRRIASLDAVREMHGRHLPIVEAEALAAFGPHLARDPGRFGPAVRRRLERARSRSRDRSPAPLYESMAPLRAQYRRELGDALLVSPARSPAARGEITTSSALPRSSKTRIQHVPRPPHHHSREK